MAQWFEQLSGKLGGMLQKNMPLAEILPKLLDPADPRVAIRPLGDDWLCPFTGRCVGVKNWDGSSSTLLQCPEIVEHLLNLPELQSKGLKAQMRSYEHLLKWTILTRLQQSPNYKVASPDGAWICPYCAQATPILLRQADGTEMPLTSFAPEALKHFQECAKYKEAPLAPRPAADVRRAELLKSVAGNPVFRVTDDSGAWICPFSERAIDGISFPGEAWGPDIQEKIVAYLLSPECPARYSNWKPERTLAEMQKIAARLSAQRYENARFAAERERHYLLQRLNDPLKTQVRVARQAQIELMPDLAPKIKGYQVVGFYEPSVALGGNFYQFGSAGEGRTGFLVGDVSAHGIDAAHFMALAVQKFRARSSGVQYPTMVLTDINHDLVSQMPAGKFITAFYAILEHATGKLRYARAGHPPALMVGPDGALQALGGEGLALGIGSPGVFAMKLKEFEVTIPPGGLVLLFTDCLTEARDLNKNEFTEARLREALLAVADLPASEVVGYILAAVREHVGHRQVSDDLTMIAIKRLAQ